MRGKQGVKVFMLSPNGRMSPFGSVLRLSEPIDSEAIKPTSKDSNGTAMCRRVVWRRQCQTVKPAKGRVGHANQVSKPSMSRGLKP